MDLLAKSDEEIFAIGKPFWENLVRSSNLKDYGSFTRDFSTQMLFGANEVELGKQWANNELITNLNETYEPFGTLRRGDHITVLIKQTNKKIPGEFLGRMVLGVEDGRDQGFWCNNLLKKILFKLNNSLTIFYLGVMRNIDDLSKYKNSPKNHRKKSTFIKTGIFSAIVACWGVILFGTFITFK